MDAGTYALTVTTTGNPGDILFNAGQVELPEGRVTYLFAFGNIQAGESLDVRNVQPTSPASTLALPAWTALLSYFF